MGTALSNAYRRPKPKRIRRTVFASGSAIPPSTNRSGMKSPGLEKRSGSRIIALPHRLRDRTLHVANVYVPNIGYQRAALGQMLTLPDHLVLECARGYGSGSYPELDISLR